MGMHVKCTQGTRILKAYSGRYIEPKQQAYSRLLIGHSGRICQIWQM